MDEGGGGVEGGGRGRKEYEMKEEEEVHVRKVPVDARRVTRETRRRSTRTSSYN